MRLGNMHWRPSRQAAMLFGLTALTTAVAVEGRQSADWGPAINAESLPTSSNQLNTSSNDGCPILDPYDNSLYMASNRPRGFQAPERLPIGEDAVNSPAEEWSPSWFEANGHEYLYFSSTREGRQRIYYSVDFGPAQLAPGGVNSSAADARPNVRRDGLEIVWDSTRFGTLGGTDIWTATRSTVDQPWGTAVHLENGINSSAGESRASLSWDGSRLMFGTTRPGEGSADIWTATR
jgi:hypothetical protein